MSDTAPPGPALRLRRFLKDWPLVPLIVLLLALVAVLQILQPGIVNERWLANMVKFAIPLALLAGCQTLCMLTGGIDLSVSAVATMSAFVVATQGPGTGPAMTIAIALAPALLIGLANGIGAGVFRVHPLIMTLGTSLIGLGVLQVYQRTVIATGTKVPEGLAWLGAVAAGAADRQPAVRSGAKSGGGRAGRRMHPSGPQHHRALVLRARGPWRDGAARQRVVALPRGSRLCQPGRSAGAARFADDHQSRSPPEPGRG